MTQQEPELTWDDAPDLVDVFDDDEHADLDHPDIGTIDLDGEEIPDDLDEGDLDDLLAQIEEEDT